jgi:class 3 adenylate cyclase/tetratricopeptide (TPR) repeat protein
VSPQRSTCTILFADMEGSARLVERLGEDAAEETRRDCFGLLRQSVATRGGREVKSVGEGLMVVFDSAVDAIACAVSMQRAIERHNHAKGDHRLDLRIGVQTGEPSIEDEDYFGTPVVVAKRLCDDADAGQILVSDLVCSLSGSRGGFSFADAGIRELKGIDDPVDVKEVVWASALEERLPLPPLIAASARSALVGRADQIRKLEQALTQVGAGQRQFVVLAGDPGIGKTRLATELCVRAHEQGGAVLYGRTSEERVIPYQPFVEALRHYAMFAPLDELAAAAGSGEVGRLVPELERRLGPLPEPVRGEPETERYRLFEAVSALLTHAASVRPLVLFVDDLQWADEPSLLLLKHVVRSQGHPFLILASYRESELERSGPLGAALADLRRDRMLELIQLGGLEEEHVRDLMSALAGHKAPASMARTIAGETQGNPFFIEEMLRHFVDSGLIDEETGRWRPRSPGTHVRLPEGVKDVIARRLARLSDDSGRALVIASVIGRDFDLRLLEQVVELPEDRLLDVLEEALTASVIMESPDAVGTYSFSHALIREALYEEPSAIRRARTHRRIGVALEELHRDRLDEHLPALAYHFCEAGTEGDLGKAIDYAARAAAQATAQLAHEEAASHYGRAIQALDLLPSPDEDTRCRLLLDLGDAHNRSGARRQAKEVFLQATAVARSLGASERLARAALGYGGGMVAFAFVPIVDTKLIELLEEALEAVGGTESEWRIWLLGRLAVELYYTPQVDRRATLAEEALAAAERLGDPRARLVALCSRYWAVWDPDAVEDRLRTSAEILALAEQLDYKEMKFQGHDYRLAALLELGQVEAARAEVMACERLADELRQPLHRWQTAMFQAGMALLEGRLYDTERDAMNALQLGLPIQPELALSAFGAHMFYVRWARGQLEELDPDRIREAAEQYPQVPGWHAALALLLCEVGRSDEAHTEFELLAAQDFADLPRDGNWLLGVYLLSETCVRLGDVERARILHDMLSPYAELSVTTAPGAICLGSAAVALGSLAATMASWDEAQAYFELALENNERMQAKPMTAWTLSLYAEMLLTAGRGREQAAPLAERALAIARELDMAGLARRTEALLFSGEAGSLPERA